MKIDPNDKLFNPATTPGMKNNTAVQGPAFADVLKNTVGSRPAEQVSGLSPIKPVIPPMVTDPGEALFRSTERALNTLERYQQQLADPGVDLRGIDPTVQQMKKQMNAMQPLMDRVMEDGQIKKIAEEALQIISKEMARYDSGAYVD